MTTGGWWVSYDYINGASPGNIASVNNTTSRGLVTGVSSGLAYVTFNYASLGPVPANVTVNASDLTVFENATSTPANPTTSAPTTFSMTVKNIGTTITGGSFNNIFQIDNDGSHNTSFATTTPPFPTARLDSGVTRSLTSISYTFPANGTYYIRGCTDNNSAMSGVIAESNENNNCGDWMPITVGDACSNGANNYPTCNTCTSPLVLSGGSCVSCTGGCTGGVCDNRANNPPSCSTYTPTASLLAAAYDVNQGGSTTLYLTCTNSASYRLNLVNGSYSGTQVNLSTGTLNTVGPNQYQLFCYPGANQSGTASDPSLATITVRSSNVYITASALRVKSPGTVDVKWSAIDVEDNSCNVTGPNLPASPVHTAFSSTGTMAAPGTTTASGVPITAQSTYTIRCTPAAGGDPVTSSVTVNILPVFEVF